MNLQEHLAVPYLLEAEAVEAEPGRWILRLAYPELEGCMAEGVALEQVLEALEHRRVDIIVSMLESGKAPPVPRRPLDACDALWTVHDVGLTKRVSALMTT